MFSATISGNMSDRRWWQFWRSDAALPAPSAPLALPSPALTDLERTDGWMSALTGVGDPNRDKNESVTFCADPVPWDVAVELWRGDDLAARTIEKIPDEMMRAGFELQIADEEEEDPAAGLAPGEPSPDDDEPALGATPLEAATDDKPNAAAAGAPPTDEPATVPAASKPAPDDEEEKRTDAAPPDEDKKPKPEGAEEAPVEGKPIAEELAAVPAQEAREGEPGDKLPIDPSKPAAASLKLGDVKLGKPLVDKKSTSAKDRAEDIMEWWKTSGVLDAIREALCYERAGGGAAILLGANDGGKMDQPLEVDRVTKFDWFTVLEGRELVPRFYYNDPLKPKYGQVEIWTLTPTSPGVSRETSAVPASLDIHETRMIIFPGIRVSRRNVGEVTQGWGDSVLTRVRRVLRDFNISWAAAGQLVHDFAQAVLKIEDLAEAISADGGKLFQKRIEGIALARSVVKMVVIDKEEEFKREQTPLAGLPDLLDRFATRLAAAADIPVTILFGEAPAGLNATGDSDIRGFYDRVDAIRDKKVIPALERMTELRLKATGKIPDTWSIKGGALWQPTEKEQAEARYIQAQTDEIYINAQVASPEEIALARFGGDSYSFETTIDFEARKLLEIAAPKPVSKPGQDPNAEPPPMTLGPDGLPMPAMSLHAAGPLPMRGAKPGAPPAAGKPPAFGAKPAGPAAPKPAGAPPAKKPPPFGAR